MFLFMPKEQLNSESVAHGKDKKDKKGRKVSIPRRQCRGCAELKYCDLDFCLRWFH